MRISNRKARVAIIAGQLVVGGAERQLYLWLSNIDRNQFEVIVLTLHPGHGDFWEKPIESLGIPLYRIPHYSNRIRRLKEMLKIIVPFHPDLIHGWHLFTSPYAGFAARNTRSISIGSLRDSFRRFYKNPLQAVMTLLLTDAVLTNSFTAAEHLQRVKLRSIQKIFAVQNAVEEIFSNREQSRKVISDTYNISSDLTWLGSVGRLDPKKRFDLLLASISLLKIEEKDFHFFLIGDGPERIKLENLAKKLHIEKFITFSGEIPNARKYLPAFDVFVFTSLDEGLPNVIMEAASVGIPIVTWHLPFFEELLENEKTALLVKPEDVVALKNAVTRLFQSPELRERLGKAAQKHILSSFSSDLNTQNMTNVYKTMLRSRKTLSEKLK